MIYCDFPFGPNPTSEQPWNSTPDKEDVKSILTSFSAATTRQNYIVVFKCNPNDSGKMREAMAETGLKNITNLYWYKTNANVTGTQKFTPSVECLLVGFAGKNGCQAFDWTMDSNPTNRHNIIFGKALSR